MKIAFSLVSLLCAPALPLLAAPDSAYQALRVIGTQRGQETLNHVIEVQGHGGVPQPTVWRVVLEDPAARGGVRELEVSHGKIVGEHTPAFAGDAGSTIDFHKLNLDSPGLFSVVEKEAQKAHLGFDSVDYDLRSGIVPDHKGPVWTVNLMSSSARSVGTISVFADDGVVASSELGTQHRSERVAATTEQAPAYTVRETDHDNVNGGPATVDEEPPRRRMDDDDTEDTQGLRVGHRIKTAILSAGESLQNFFTGHHSD